MGTRKDRDRDRNREKMILISVHVPKHMLDELDRLVQEGRFPNRSEAIRVAIRDLLLRERKYMSQTGRDMEDIPLVPGR